MPPGRATLLAERYERRSVMVTSNLVFSPWDRNVRAPSRLSPVRYVTVRSSRGVDERGAAGALPGAAEGWRVPDPVPPAGGPEIAATAGGTTRCTRSWRCRTSTGSGGTRCRNPSPGPRPRSCSSRSAIWICRYWRLSSCPGASGVTARPPPTASGWRSRRGAGRRHPEAVDACGVVLLGSDPPPGRPASLSGGRRRVAAGRPACQRAARVLRDATALRVTRRPPRGSDGSYGPCGPAWTGRPGRPRRSRDAADRRIRGWRAGTGTGWGRRHRRRRAGGLGSSRSASCRKHYACAGTW